MDYLISSLFFLFCIGLLSRMLRSRDVVDFQLGVIAAFSIGYYCLPVWFKHLSPLGYEKEDDVAQAVLIFFMFGLFVTFGTWIGRRIVPHSIALRTDRLDSILLRRRKLLTTFVFLYYLWYYFTQDLTSYTAQDTEAYFNFNERGPFSAIIATVANISLTWITLSLAISWRERRHNESILYSAMLGTCIVLLMFVGQRLAIITPIITLVAALAVTQQMKKASKTLVIGILVLILVSPLAVFVRESLANRDASNAKEAVDSFNYGEDPLTAMFQSIIDRGDLIYVTVGMKPRLDADPLPGAIYYASVLLTPVPRTFFPSDFKPFRLSTNGLPTGELSIYAWNTLKGEGIGSLSAFGGIVAYRELGWAGVILNGLMTGLFFVFVARWLGRGGFLAAIFYSGLFVSLTVTKVPPSFWEAVLALMSILPFLAFIYLIDVVFSRFRKLNRTPIG